MTLALRTVKQKFTKEEGNKKWFFISEYMIARIKKNGRTFRIIYNAKEGNIGLGTYTIFKVNKAKKIQATSRRDTYYECIIQKAV